MPRNASPVCLVGAGYISDIHAEALTKIPGVYVGAIVDPNQAAAEALAKRWKAGHVFTTPEQAIESGHAARAHILAPPHLHRQLAETFIAAKIPVLVEKPLCVSRDECDSLTALAGQSAVPVGVNQNFVFHPAVLRMQDLLKCRRYGRLQYLHCLYNAPLRQLAAGQFSHWMFQQPGNILLEQAVHPLSLMAALAGEIQDVSATTGNPVEIAPGIPFYDCALFNLRCAHAPAQLSFAVGKDFPFWQVTAVCDDGVIVADLLRNHTCSHARTRWLDPADHAASGLRTAAGLAFQSARGLVTYALTSAGLRPRSDAFYQSMENSIRAFHASVDEGKPVPCDAAFGARLVQVCEETAARLFATALPRTPAMQASAAGCDVAVLGGTGFIGHYAVRQLVKSGKRVAVMARSVNNLPEIYTSPEVTLVRGDVRNPDDVLRGIGDAPIVINLAHGGGGGDWAAVQAAMAGSARIVAEACLARGVKRLLHIGSIAGLYLGDPDAIITGTTPPDPQAEERADYARAKAEADRLLLQMHREKHLPVVILRPGVVVGAGSPPFHSGLGTFNNTQHCLGWNDGQNSLPFVLAEDVASAIVAACSAPGIEGKCYNLVSGVHMNARAYLRALGAALQRPLYFHGQSVRKLQAVEMAKWLVKRAAGRKTKLPSYRDILSRGMRAKFDCSDARRDLNWRPADDLQHFTSSAITCFSPGAK